MVYTHSVKKCVKKIKAEMVWNKSQKRTQFSKKKQDEKHDKVILTIKD